jgi:tripartite-type tricarboxylate transporter receptor subunit TctC
MAARAAPDGYTLFLPIDSTLAMNQSFYTKLPYDSINGCAPVSLAITSPWCWRCIPRWRRAA